MSETEAPEVLWKATRQYRGQKSDEFVCAYDAEITDEIVIALEIELEEKEERLKICSADRLVMKKQLDLAALDLVEMRKLLAKREAQIMGIAENVQALHEA